VCVSEENQGRKRKNADLDGNEWIEAADGGFEGDEVRVLVGEDAKVAGFDAQTDTGSHILL
jgi:hypothetical protein